MINWATERRKISDLKDYPHNPRTFTEKGMADLKKSLTRLGYIDPIAVNKDGMIIGGHARKQMLLELGLVEIDVRVPDKLLTPKQIEEAVIRLNRNTAGTWDFKMLEAHFAPVDLFAWGFEKSEFNSFGAKADPEGADEEIPTPSVAVTVLGDQWMLDTHSLRCGDSTNPEDVSNLLGGARPHLMVTDPPYGVNYDPSWRIGSDKFNKKSFNVDAVDRSLGKVMNDDRADWSAAWSLFPGDVCYVWHGGLHTAEVQESLESSGFIMRTQIIWVKQHFVFGRGSYHWQHEPCWYAVKKGKKGHYVGDRKQTTVWDIKNNNPMGRGNTGAEEERSGHGTQKPVECMRRPIENNSQPGDMVYEPFSGSGSTIIAAELSGRRCYAMELDPLYVDMAILRWQKLTGKSAVHAVTGKPFAGDIDVGSKKKKAG